VAHIAALLEQRQCTPASVTCIDVKLLDPRLRDQPPHYATAGAAGLDLRACIAAPLDYSAGGNAADSRPASRFISPTRALPP
jgi:hypothetical protein